MSSSFVTATGTTSNALMAFVVTGAVNEMLVDDMLSSWTYNIVKTSLSIKSYQRTSLQPVKSETVSFEIDRSADLLSELYLIIQLPPIYAHATSTGTGGGCGSCGIVVTDPLDPFQDEATQLDSKNACRAMNVESFGADVKEPPAETETSDALAPQGNYVCYVNHIGYALWKSVEFKSGGSSLDKLYSDFAYAWKELTGIASKDVSSMTGGFGHITEAIEAASDTQLLYVPIGFWFTHHSGSAFPLVSCQYSKLSITVNLRDINKLILKNSADVEPRICGTQRAVKTEDIIIGLEQGVVFLDCAERKALSGSNFSRIMTTGTPSDDNHKPTGSVNHSIKETLNGTCLSTIILAQRKKALAMGSYFGYAGVHGKDPLTKIQFLLNNSNHIEREAKFYRTVTHLNDWPSAKSNRYIYTYNWANSPHDWTTNGTGMNYDRLDSVGVKVTYADNLKEEEMILKMYHFCYNVIQFQEGLVAVSYAL
jgi:hypothetical protein